ncbi:MAG: 6-pyruvoyl-tetrahydropterin synthase-related protein [Actinobacteria bacterium]|nr:6-pyruvoyl-tetrahydropterin synthase-related protein [Actinomycetota bacterium]
MNHDDMSERSTMVRRWSNQFELNADYWRRLSAIIVVGGATIFLLLTLHPDLILRNNTPTGGDMGAHVWGPAFLRDHLLNNFRLAGWSMDWYAGLPVYRYYMVVPALFIVALNLVLPYGIAIKIAAVIGILTLPYCAWLFGRFARFAYPIPEMLAIAATIFLYDESFTIYGGNIASTMAGEFSFSIALSLSILGFALVARGLETGKYLAAGSIVVALSALSHGIVLLFVFGGVALMLLFWVQPKIDGRRDNTSLVFGVKVIIFAVLLSSFWVIPFVTSHAYMTDMKYEPRPSGSSDSFWSMYFPLSTLWDVIIMSLALLGLASQVVRRHKIGMWMGAYAVLLAAGVYFARGGLPVIGLLWNPRILPFFYLLRYFLFAIGVYEVVAFAARVLSLERVARQALSQHGSDDGEQFAQISSARTKVSFNLGVLVALVVATFIVVGFRFQELPFGSVKTNAAGKSEYVWGPIRGASSNDGFVDGWARWNFTGYEGKSAYGEYHDVIATMKSLGADPSQGCGRAVWENNGELNKYGTTMGLMLLPFWTDGCISSMEGLFFEAAGTTPYHFITAAAMSKQSSNPVRELRYDNNDAAKGVAYMRALGVKYFMGFTPEAVTAASAQPGLMKVAQSGPWVIFRVTESELVVPLSVQPVVVSMASGDPRERWLEIGTSWFQHADEWAALPADAGPQEWQHVDAKIDLTRREGEPGASGRRVDIVTPSQAIETVALPPVVVSNVEMGQSDVSFSVDKIGVPVLVRVSYFPNWKVGGATGPFRVAPNMMVVIPTSNTVKLHYGSTSLDYMAYLLTFIGIGVLVRRRHRMRGEFQ